MAAKTTFGWRLFGGLSAILAGVAARKILVRVWRLGTGTTPPANPAAPDTQWREAVPFALASGAAVGLARLLATRKAATYYRSSTGHLPRGMEEVS